MDARYQQNQRLALCTAALLTPALRLHPAIPAQLAGRAAWLSPLAALPVLLLYGRFLRALLSRKPGNVQQPEVTFVWFEPDERKDGGAYVTRTGIVKKIDDAGRTVLLEDGILIPMDALSEIEF